MNQGREDGLRVAKEYGKWALAGAFFFLPLNGMQRLGGLAPGDLLLVASLVLAVIVIGLQGRVPRTPLWLMAAGALFLGGFLISESSTSLDTAQIKRLFPYGFDPAGLGLAKLLISLVALPVTAVVLARDWSAIRLLSAAWVAGVSVSCLSAFLDASFDLGLQSFLSNDGKGVEFSLRFAEPPRSPGLTSHPNSLAITAVLATPVLLAWMNDHKKVLFGFPLLVLFAWAVLLSGSRTGLVAFILVVGASLALDGAARKAILVPDLRQAGFQLLVVFSSVLILFGGPGLVDEFGAGESSKRGDNAGPLAGVTRLDPNERSANASDFQRRRILDNTFELISERPITGSGFELIQAPHNIYLQPLLAGGLLALAGFIVAWIGFLRTGLRNVALAHGAVKSLALALNISILAYLVMGLLMNNMLDRFLYLGPALILAISVVLAGGQQNQERNSQSGRENASITDP